MGPAGHFVGVGHPALLLHIPFPPLPLFFCLCGFCLFILLCFLPTFCLSSFLSFLLSFPFPNSLLSAGHVCWCYRGLLYILVLFLLCCILSCISFFSVSTSTTACMTRLGVSHIVRQPERRLHPQTGQ
uniref:Uncharacterized protein n=1 Tax=Myotis myotis TaxID=51298 RepID=A0A7J7RKM3_MYOMY|nr:hypothetical protein mMyoMyo1_010294 [Myotis myotis]